MKNILKSRALMLIAMLSLCLSSWAEGTGTKEDPYVLENGKSYELTSFVECYAKFVVPETVTADNVSLVIDDLLETAVFCYSDAEMTQEVESQMLGSSPFTFKLPIAKGTEAGTTYYIYFRFPQSTYSVTVAYGENAVAVKPLKLVSVTPEDGRVLSAASSLVSFTFSKDVQFSSAKLAVNGEEYSVIANSQGRYVSTEPKYVLLDLYENNLLKEGDDITVTLVGVKSTYGSEELGNVSVTYKAAAKPLLLVSEENTPGNGLDTFLSWMPENFANGVVTLTFDGTVNNRSYKPKACLSYGNVEYESESYYEELPVVVDKNTVSVDLRGVLRTLATMKVASFYDNITLQITNVRDAKGNYAFSDGLGSLGSYGFNYKFKIVEYNIMSDFTPAKGGSIDGAKGVEMWIRETGDGKLTFEGAKFSYVSAGKDESVTVALDNISVEVDPEDENARIITVPVPEFNRDADTEVKFSLTGVTYPDGNDYADKVSATFSTKGHETAISEIRVDSAKNSTLYNVNGIRVKSANSKNLYISNGKKFVK